MKTKTYIISGITMIMLTGMWACIIDNDCGDTMKYDGLSISFTVTDSAGNHYQDNFYLDSITIYTLDNPEREIFYSVLHSVIQLSFSNIEPYVGSHNHSFIIQWDKNTSDTLRTEYYVSEPEGVSCTYEFIFEHLYFNGKECFQNPRTNRYECCKRY
jgi:hypothetical protein